MHDFHYKEEKELYCENVSVDKIAEKTGTPFYLYSHNTILNHYRVFDSAFKDIDHLVCFAVKANSNLSVLNIFAKEGGGFDSVSGGEIFRALKAGADPQKIVYAGVGKTNEEISYALQNNILMFNVESSQELFAIDEAAERLGVKANVALRINPDISAATHPYITTGMKENKFGINISTALNDYKLANNFQNINVVGIHHHIGSQITQISPFVDALQRILDFADTLKKEGINTKYLNMGGGLGITYKDESPPAPKELAEHLTPILQGTGYKIIFEPGRVIVGNAGVLVTKVLYTKSTEGKDFLIVDAGMNDLLRPTLYNAYHEIIPVHKTQNTKTKIVDVVGPICESGDFFAKDRMLPEIKKNDLLTVMSTGGYGFTMSSNYNSRRRIPEVLVKEDEFSVIRKREEYEDIIRGEEIPAFLQ